VGLAAPRAHAAVSAAVARAQPTKTLARSTDKHAPLLPLRTQARCHRAAARRRCVCTAVVAGHLATHVLAAHDAPRAGVAAELRRAVRAGSCCCCCCHGGSHTATQGPGAATAARDPVTD
jgi:hypothetical protein